MKNLFIIIVFLFALYWVGWFVRENYDKAHPFVKTTVRQEMYRYDSAHPESLGMACIQKRVFQDGKLVESNGVCCALPEIFNTPKGCSQYMPIMPK
jgi:hypothetical protein